MDSQTVAPTSRHWAIDLALSNEIGFKLLKARALVKVIDELVLPGGDAVTGEISLENVGVGDLSTVLGVVAEMLAEIQELFDSAPRCDLDGVPPATAREEEAANG